MSDEWRLVKMVADQNLRKNSEVTPFIAPLVACLNTSELLSRCSGCFRKLDEDTKQSKSVFVKYCSHECEATDLPIHLNSGEHRLFTILKEDPKLWTHLDSTHLRLALRFLHLFPPDSPAFIPYTNPNSRLDYFPNRILALFYQETGTWNGPLLMASARPVSDSCIYHSEEHSFEHIALSLALTNAVDVNSWGLALYDHRISMINHSCKPNAELVFNLYPNPNPDDNVNPMKIKPFHDLVDKMLDRLTYEDLEIQNYGPRVAVKLKRKLKDGEEVSISYVKSNILRDEEVADEEELDDDWFFVDDIARL